MNNDSITKRNIESMTTHVGGKGVPRLTQEEVSMTLGAIDELVMQDTPEAETAADLVRKLLCLALR